MTHLCCCCLVGSSDKALRTPQTLLGITEIYSDKLEECFQIHLIPDDNEEYGICSECVERLHDASNFKLQVQRSQAELRARLVQGLQVKEDEIAVKLENVEEDGIADEILHKELPVKAEVPADDGTIDNYSLSTTRSRPLCARTGTCSVNHEQHEPTPATRYMEIDASCEARNKQAYTCVTCGKRFARKFNLTRHSRLHAGQETNTELKTKKEKVRLIKPKQVHTVEKRFTCDTCNKRFTRKDALKSHIITHTGQKPYICEICEKEFNRKDNLSAHSRIHTGQKLHCCETCNKQFSHKSDLKRHMRTHTGQKPYNCKICNKQFSQKGSLNMHNRTYTGQKPYICLVCNKRFSHKDTLDGHIRLHTGQKPFSCDICNKQFTHRQNYNRHINRTNPCRPLDLYKKENYD